MHVYCNLLTKGMVMVNSHLETAEQYRSPLV